MIKLENINKTYNNGSPLHVLKGIDLEVGKGELVSIMGASGSGKSTLLNILGILDDYDSGNYYLAGRLIKNLNETQAAAARNRMIGYIFQSFNLINYKNAVENVALPLYYQGVARRKRNSLALEYLDMLGLRDWAAHMPNDRRPDRQDHPPERRRHQQHRPNGPREAMRELLLEIWTSVRRNKLRTFLTGFSVAWGIFMLVILLGSGNGLKNGVTANFDDYATNSIDLYGGWTSKPWMGYEKGRRIRMRNSDLEILRREFPEIEEVAANSWLSGHKATYGKEFTQVWLRGSLPKVQQIEGIKLSAGRFINEDDVKNYRKTIVIDEPMRRLLFKGGDPLGKQVKVGKSIYTVVGVEKGDAQRNNSSCYIPLTTGQLIYKGNDPIVNNAILTLRGIDTDEQMEDFENRLIRRLSVEHHFAPDDRSAIWIQNTMEQYKSMMVVFGGINLFVWIIGLGTLLAGIVGVSNIMLVTVTERTAEFGIRKALGAKPASIIRLILAESVMITAAFGYMGMVLGVAVMEAVNHLLNQTPVEQTEHGMNSVFLDPTLDLGVAVSATLVLVAAGLIAGYIPAYRAAQLKTIDALRYNK